MEALFIIYVIFAVAIFICCFIVTVMLVLEHKANYLSGSDRKWLKRCVYGFPFSFVWPLFLPAMLVWGVLWLVNGVRAAWS